PVGIDVGDHLLGRRSSSAAKKAEVHSIRWRNTIRMGGGGWRGWDGRGGGHGTWVVLHGPEVRRWLCATSPQAAAGVVVGGRPGGDLPRPGPGGLARADRKGAGAGRVHGEA